MAGRGRRRANAGARVWALLIIPAVCGSCSSNTRKFQPPQDMNALDDTTFLHQLQALPVVSVDEGMRAVLLLRGSTDQWPSYGERFEELKRLGAVREPWRLKPDDRLDKGTLAYMVARLAGLRPSVNDRLAAVTGLGDRRYAMKTCIDAGIMSYAVPSEPVAGGELRAVLALVEETARGKGDDNSPGASTVP